VSCLRRDTAITGRLPSEQGIIYTVT